MTTPSRHALVTGGAVRIGAEIVRTLHRRGLNVMIHCHSSRERAAALADGLNDARPGSAVVHAADLGVDASRESLVDACRAWCGERLDLLVNNASEFYPTPVGSISTDDWDTLVDSNLRGPLFLTQGLVPALRSARGAAVNLLDVHAERPMKAHVVYSIAKAGLRMMTLSLARELGPEIRVNGVAPGAILWPESETDDLDREAILARTALGRTGDAADIASAVAYLGLDAPYVTGQVLAVDGGRLLTI